MCARGEREREIERQSPVGVHDKSLDEARATYGRKRRLFPLRMHRHIRTRATIIDDNTKDYPIVMQIMKRGRAYWLVRGLLVVHVEEKPAMRPFYIIASLNGTAWPPGHPKMNRPSDTLRI